MPHQITILTDKNSWMLPHIAKIKLLLETTLYHKVSVVFDQKEIQSGEIAFFLSCSELVRDEILKKNKHNLVVHESALPKGKGWSPLTWQILEGKDEIPICLFEAQKNVDSGDVYIRDTMRFNGTELLGELREIQGQKTVQMCIDFVSQYPNILKTASKQIGDSSTYRRRYPDASRLDPEKTLAEQFNLLRVVDNERYPAFFIWKDRKYLLKIEKSNE